MAKRLSSFFSSKEDDDLPRPYINARLDAEPSPPPTPPRGKLTKPMTMSTSDIHLNRNLEIDLEPPPMFTNSRTSSRPISRDGRSPARVDTASSRHSSGSRPQTPTMLAVPGTESPVRSQSPVASKLGKRRSWMPGKLDRQSEAHDAGYASSCQAWIAGLREEVPYDLTKLLNGEPVDDLWDENGDVIVYLYPETSRKGPSFRLSSELFADSRSLCYLNQPGIGDGHNRALPGNHDPASYMASLSLQDREQRTMSSDGAVTHFSRPMYNTLQTEQQQVKSVYLPLGLEGDFSTPGTKPSGDDLELVVLYRNFFAFLRGGALVSTRRQNSLYAIFMAISSILRRLQYGNEKGSSWGAVPWASFSRYTEELRLADVRTSREKNIEALLLGVTMKSWPLYAEGFSHAVGRLADLKSINSPKFDKLPPAIVNKLERAHHDLQVNRLSPLHAKLDNFYFPSMFAGIANSQTATEAKLVSFKSWKAYFMDLRQHTMTIYKKRYGSWPPKASSKKNDFEESGLNRILIRQMYEDFTNLYELLVDRTSLTTRTTDLLAPIADDAEVGSRESIQQCLRTVESEYDRSSLPVVPPIPFDVPIIPAFSRLMLGRDTQSTKKLKDNDLHELLVSSYNKESIKRTPWLDEFREYERKLCHGKTVQELAEIRCGHWLFMYAVLQALPMTVVDARDLQYTQGVEYFLCEGPRGGRPWMEEDESTSRAWFNVASGGGLVSMPADTIDHSVEGIYRRSHCWTIATKWAEALGPMSPMSPVQPFSNTTHFPAPVLSPSPYLAPRIPSANPSPYNSPLLKPMTMGGEDAIPALPKVSSRTSMHLGLQEVAAPVQVASRPKSLYNPNVTFDNIFASQNIRQKGGKKEKR